MPELSDHTRETTQRVARAMYPHDALPDEAYEKVVRQIEADARGNEAIAATIAQGIAELDQPTPFKNLDAEAQLAALQRVEGSDYFNLVRATAGSFRIARDLPNLPAWICKTVGGTTLRWAGCCPRGARADGGGAIAALRRGRGSSPAEHDNH